MTIQIQQFEQGTQGRCGLYEEAVGAPECIAAESEDAFLAHCLELEATGWQVSLETPRGGALQYALTKVRDRRCWRLWLLP